MPMQLIDTPNGSRIHIPMNLKKRSGRKQIIVPDLHGCSNPESKSNAAVNYRDAMVIAIARGFRWKKLLDDGKYQSISHMAGTLGVAAPYMSMIIRLTLLAPDIIKAIVDGREPDGLSIERLRKPMPLLWEEQWNALKTP
ncbi:MAG: hypothetical protein NT018_07780 [Armatimonadetes bacterium]|nr:hypothetical protein [Armatimonadota bacterium]